MAFNEDTRQFLRDSNAPIVIVSASPEAERASQKNGLRFVDLLAPFADVGGSPVTTKFTSTETTYRLHGFTVRFFDGSEFSAPPREQSEADLGNLLRRHAELVASEMSVEANSSKIELTDRNICHQICDTLAGGNRIHDQTDSNEGLQEHVTDTTWFTDYRREFQNNLRCSEHEYIHHPTACIIIVSSSEPNPIQRLQELFSPQHLPAAFQAGFLDPHILRYYVLVHDKQDGPTDDIREKVFRDMKSTFGSSLCSQLVINSVNPKKMGSLGTLQPDIWTPVIPIYRRKWKSPSGMNSGNDIGDDVQVDSRPLTQKSSDPVTEEDLSHPLASRAEASLSSEPDNPLADTSDVDPTPDLSDDIQCGAFLDGNDLVSISTFVHDFVQRGLIAHLERKIRTLNDMVNVTRLGLKNKLKSWWSGKPTAVAPRRSDGSAVYRHTSMESQIRQLGDFAFMLQDYDLAIQSYSLLVSDFKRDKAMRHLASCHEMLGQCSVMIGPNRRDAETYYDSAYAVYQQVGATRYATRVTLHLADLLRIQGRKRDAAAALLRAVPAETDTVAGLMLEQAAVCFLTMRPNSAFRKYAFHLILAGHRYGQCGQRRHALRCYASALGVYHEKGWSMVEDHIVFTVARQTFRIGELRASLAFFLYLLRISRQNEQRQQGYLREFLHVFKVYAVPGLILPNMGLFPVINSSVRVLLADDAGTGTDVEAMGRAHSTGPSHAEERAWAALESEMNVRLGNVESTRFPPPPPVQHDRVCVVGEYATVVFELSNPMKVPVHLSRMKLRVKHTSGGEEAITRLIVENCDMVKLEEIEQVVINPDQVASVRLRMMPLVEGAVEITGFSFLFQGIVASFTDFKLPGRRLNTTKMERCTKMYAPNRMLFLDVAGGALSLHVQLHQLPRALLHGECRRATLEVTNTGAAPLESVALRLSHPSFFSVGDPDEIDLDFPKYVKKGTSPRSTTSPCTDDSLSWDPAFAMLKLSSKESPNASLQPGETLLIPLWLHGRQNGFHRFRFLFVYGSNLMTSSRSFRTLKLAHELHVLSSVRAWAHVKADKSNLGDYILSMELTNLSESRSLRLLQVSSITAGWCIHHLGRDPQFPDRAEDMQGTPILQTKESRHVHFFVRPLSSEQKSNDAAREGPVLKHIDLPFHGDTVDSSAQPIPDLVRRERRLALQDDVLRQRHTSTVRSRFDSIVEPVGNLSRIRSFSKSVGDRDSSAIAKEKIPRSHQLDLAVFWQSEAPSGVGPVSPHQSNPHPVTGVTIVPHLILQEPSRPVEIPAPPRRMGGTVQRCPLMCSVISSRRVSHDFMTSGLCAVPVVLKMRNVSHSTSLRCTFEALSVPQDSSSSGVRVHPRYLWMGSSRRIINALEPGQEKELSVDVCFTAPGTYDLNRMRVVAFQRNAAPQSPPLAQLTPSHIITVESGHRTAIGHDRAVLHDITSSRNEVFDDIGLDSSVDEKVHISGSLQIAT